MQDKNNRINNPPPVVCFSTYAVLSKTKGIPHSFYRAGFTLIELLVVVLTIGILASVALPQYRKAVEKSKSIQAITLLKSVYNAAQSYQFANGEWPSSFEELAVAIPWTGSQNGIQTGKHKPGKSNQDWSIQIRNSSNDATRGIVVTRISGTYKGASFAIYSVPEYTQFLADELLCIEMRGGAVASSYAFDQRTGSYCSKIMKATSVRTTSSGSWDHFRML